MSKARYNAQQQLAVSGRYERYRILVADDQESILDLVNATVEKTLRASVLSCEDGDRALAALEKEAFDVFVTDMMMPGTRGFELLARVQEVAPEMDVIVMTGYPDDFPYVEVIRAGADDFINKPFAPSELVAKLIRLFDEHELRRQRLVAESKYKSLFELAVDGMLCLSSEDYQVTDANHAFHEITGFAPGDLDGKTVMEIVDASERDRFSHWLDFCNTTGRGMIADLTLQDVHGKPIAADISATITDAGDERIIFVSFKDVTEKRERERLLAHAAERDALTGLYNRRAFNSRLDWAIAKARANATPLSLMYIDLDSFKQVNDSLGHATGDAVLQTVGETIISSIRTQMGDEGFRFGGDEFAVLLPGADESTSVGVAERLREAFADKERHGTSMSIGVARYEDGQSMGEFSARADQALYCAKEQGKDVVRVG